MSGAERDEGQEAPPVAVPPRDRGPGSPPPRANTPRERRRVLYRALFAVLEAGLTFYYGVPHALRKRHVVIKDQEAPPVTVPPRDRGPGLPPPRANTPRQRRRTLDIALFALLAASLTVYFAVPYALGQGNLVVSGQDEVLAGFGCLAIVLLIALLIRSGSLRTIRRVWSGVFPIELGWRSDRERRAP